MKKIIWISVIICACVSICLAQQNDSPTGDKPAANIILKAGSRVAGELKDTLDVKQTKNSDDFVLLLSDDIRGAGIVITKGTELLGRVVRVKELSSDDNTSEISLFFDFVKLDDDYLRFKASVTSITAENTGADKQTSLFKTEMSPIFKGATVISTKGKNLVIDAGLIFHLKLEQDLVKP